MRKHLSRLMPDPQALARNEGLRWIAPLLRQPSYWHLDRRRVALGIGIGVFFAIVTPVAQMLLAALAAIRLRANVPIAVAATFTSNPLTAVPLMLAEWNLGAIVLGRAGDAPDVATLLDAGRWWPPGAAWDSAVTLAAALGKPMLVGIPLLAVAAGALAWGGVRVAWRWSVQRRWRTRHRRPRRP